MVIDHNEISILNELDLLEKPLQERIDSNHVHSYVSVSDKSLNIIHLNIRSIRKNFNNLLVLLQAYNLYVCDIIILSECWQIIDDKNFNIEGYNIYYNQGQLNQNDSVVIYTKQNINFNFTNFKLNTSGVTLTKLCFHFNDTTYGVTCGYRPPSSDIHCFLNDLEDYLLKNSTNQIELFLGDINIDILKKDDNSSNLYLSIFSTFGYESLINGYTRVTSSSMSCLDHIFIRNQVRNKFNSFSYILDADLTDHFPIMINLSNKNIMGQQRKSITKVVETINVDTFENRIKDIDWHKVTSINNVELATDHFSNIISDIIKHSTIKKSYNYKENKKIKPWISNGIIESIKKRDRMKKKLLLNYSNNEEVIYKTYRNNLNKIIQKRKHDYYKQKIEYNCNNYKTIYKIISEATDEAVPDRNSPLQIKDDNAIPFSNNAEMANYCNKYFNEVGVEMFEKIETPVNLFQLQYNSESSMFLTPVSDKEIIQHISTLKNNCSSGVDKVNAELIKRCHMYLVKPLKHIINLIFETGVVPSHFKIAIITPIFKAGDQTKVNNYRPISVISNFSKVFEKCIKSRLENFLQKNQILSKNQFAFTNGLSTNDAIYELTRNITNNLDNNKKCLTVFLDLAKAFDTVPHNTLLDVLNAYGVRGVVLDVFKSYLSERQQTVKIGNSISDPLIVKIGVPQGTVLGPLLFITYINSLTDIKIDNGLVVSYADDTAVIFSGSSWDNVKISAEDGITKIMQWLNTFKLTLNIAKTNYIAFSLTAANRPNFSSLQLDDVNSELNEVDSTKYLGLIIDLHLKWDKHVTKLSNNIRRLILKFYTLREILSKKLLLTIYKSLVESLLRYGLLAWGALYNTSLRQLNVVQKYILKVINRKGKMFPTKYLFSKDLLDIRSLYILNVCSLVHKSSNPNIKTFVKHTYNTRCKINKHLSIPNSNTNINKRFINYLAPKFYNLIPYQIKSIIILKKFNQECSQFIFENLNKFLCFL